MVALAQIHLLILWGAQAAEAAGSVQPRYQGLAVLAVTPVGVAAAVLRLLVLLLPVLAAKAVTRMFAWSHSSEVKYAQAISSQT